VLETPIVPLVWVTSHAPRDASSANGSRKLNGLAQSGPASEASSEEPAPSFVGASLASVDVPPAPSGDAWSSDDP